MMAEGLEDASWAAGLLALCGPSLGGAVVDDASAEAFLAAYAAAAGSTGGLRAVPASVPAEALTGALDLAATLALGKPVQSQGLLIHGRQARLLLRRAGNLDAACAALMAQALDRNELMLVAVTALDDPDSAIAARLSDRLSFQVSGPAEPCWHFDEIEKARPLLADMTVKAALVDELCRAAVALGVSSPRAALQGLGAARGIAALQGLGEVDERSLALAARLVLAHRATRFPQPEQPEQPEQSPEPPPEQEAADHSSMPEPSDAEVLLEAVKAALPPDLLQFAGNSGLGSRGTGRKVKSTAASKSKGKRGRRIGNRRSSTLSGQRLDVLATLRTAAPWQGLRQQLSAGNRMIVTRDDFRVHRIKQRTEATAILAVDASGSTAFQRLAEAKGAVETILAECYVRRDRVALVSFRSKKAETLLPPTRSLERAKRALAGLPGGGGTPLAAGLDEALALALQVRRTGGHPIVIVLTDGRANVTRSGQGDKAVALQEMQAAARLFAAEGLEAMVIDVSPQPQASAKTLAAAMQARYLPMPQARAAEIARPVSAALKTVSA